jgi:hypothetical protein
MLRFYVSDGKVKRNEQNIIFLVSICTERVEGRGMFCGDEVIQDWIFLWTVGVIFVLTEKV